MALIQLKAPVGDLGVRSQERPMKVRGIYILRSPLRRIIKATTMMTATINEGTKAQRKADADVDEDCCCCWESSVPLFSSRLNEGKDLPQRVG